ncbi:glycosyltransferase family 4 protein [bacterium]|nr:glycosyltransferase family 4 protein [bacterium]
MTLARPYHLCFVNSMRGWGGAEVWMHETALALRDRGVAVSFVANPGSELHRRAVADGLPVAPLTIRVDGAPWTIVGLARRLRRLGATALVANQTKDVKVGAPAGRLAGLRHILSTRESDFPLKDRPDYRWAFQVLCTGVLVNSEATRRTTLASAPWLDPARVHLLYKGIDIERFAAGPVPTGPFTVGFVGQLIGRKGVPELMTAWSAIDAEVRPERPRLRLAGDGELRADLERWRGGLRHPDAVEILGYVEDVPAFYRTLHLLAMPSHAEGFGLAAAEALACDVPVVAGDASSLPEIVRPGETGLLVPPRDPAALTDALRMLIDDPVRARSLGLAGGRFVRAAFPRTRTLDRLLALTGHPDHPPEEHPA